MNHISKTNPLDHIIQSLERRNSTIELRCGDTKGPFTVIEKERGCVITKGYTCISVTSFTGEIVFLECEKDKLLERILPCSSPLYANCVVLQSDNEIRILITKDVMMNDKLFGVLIAEKDNNNDKRKYECTRCGVAKFSEMKNMRTHQELYCMKKEWRRKRKEEKEEDKTVILLPLGYHDIPNYNSVQLLGPIHSIVPVAVPRNSESFTTNPIYLHNKDNLVLPNSVNISLHRLGVNIPIVNLNEENPIIASLLELTEPKTNETEDVSSRSSTPKSKASDPEKQYSCSCGVSFANEKTFEAHQKFYCKNSTESSLSSSASKSDRKVPDKCSQCEFVPISTSQLAMHIRTVHTSTRTFTCKCCGYRAFSMRGIRTHMRSHPLSSAHMFDANQPIEEE